MLELYVRLVNWFKSHEEGQTLVEYALIIVLFALIALVGLALLGSDVSSLWSKIGSRIVAVNAPF